MDVDLLVHSAAQLCTVPPNGGGPQRGARLGDLGLIENGAVAVRDGIILDVGPTPDLRSAFEAQQEIDAAGTVICPGFVDPHTHLVWMGDRAAEFEQRVAGATYMEIMEAGGGIMSTVRATREASVDELVAAARLRLDRMLAHGTTTVEIKTGYGLAIEAELRQLEAIVALGRFHPATVVPTFLGAHAIPTAYRDRPDAYVDLVIEEMLPAVAGKACALEIDLPFCDVFCEEGAFNLRQTRRILEAARDLGFPLKVHVDEFKALGGTRLAVELEAASADHLVKTAPEDVAALGRAEKTVAVSLPCTPFGLGHTTYTPARALLAAGAALALASDCNPGTAWNESMPFVIALACRFLHLTSAQALVAATLNAAHALNLGASRGSLTPGYAADLLVLDLPDYRHVGYRFGSNPIAMVIKDGEVVVERGVPR